MFTVVESFVKGQRHITVNRTLELTDFTFSVNPYESTDIEKTKIQVGVNVEGTMKPGVLSKIVAVFPKDECHLAFDRYHRENRELLATGIRHRSESVEDDYRGCRTEGSRNDKLARVLPGMREKVNAMSFDARKEIVAAVNKMIAGLVKQINDDYARSAIQNLTQRWEGIHEEAGTVDKISEIAILMDRVHQLRNQVKADLNAWVLKDLETNGWKVNGKKLAQPVIDVLREKYTKNEAFSSSERIFV